MCFGGGTFLSPEILNFQNDRVQVRGQECPPSEAHKVFLLRIAANSGQGSQLRAI